MRILYISRTLIGHDQRFIRAWERAGLDVSALATGHGGPIDDETSPTTRDTIRAQIDAFRPDLVQVGPLTSPAWDVIQVWNGPIIATSWGFDLLSEVDANDEVARRARAVVDRSDLLFVDNGAPRRRAEEWDFDSHRIVQFPWGLDGIWFAPRGNPAFSDPSKIVVLCVRRHEHIYHVGDVVEAFLGAASDHPNIQLRLAGSGSLTEQLKKRVDRSGLGSQVEFVGEMVPGALSNVYRSADLYVTASEVDGTSVSLLEAMGSGTPVIASRIEGNAEWVDDDTGFVFDVGAVEQLEAHIRDFARAEPHTVSEAHRRAANAHARVRSRADWSATVSRFPQYAHEAIGHWRHVQ